MKRFYLSAFLFWFVLLALTIGNAIFHEATYKPLLEPIIGIWAHQISSLTCILLFFAAIYLFLKHSSSQYSRSSLLIIGLMWIGMTLIFETWMNMSVRKLTSAQVLETYYFWKGETWIFVLLSLLLIPQIIYSIRMSQKR